MPVPSFDEAIARIREQVAAAEKAASKNSLTVSQVLRANGPMPSALRVFP